MDDPLGSPSVSNMDVRGPYHVTCRAVEPVLVFRRCLRWKHRELGSALGTVVAKLNSRCPQSANNKNDTPARNQGPTSPRNLRAIYDAEKDGHTDDHQRADQDQGTTDRAPTVFFVLLFSGHATSPGTIYRISQQSTTPDST